MSIKLKPLHPMPYGFKRSDLVDCAKREVAMRFQVYPGLIAKKRITKLFAEREIGMMEQVVDAIKLAMMCENADLCVAAMIIELRKYAQLNDFFNMFSHGEMEAIQKNISNHIRENIYEVEHVAAELGLEGVEVEDGEEDVGL